MNFTREVTITDSSNLRTIKYDRESLTLSVTFRNKETYIYEGVSPIQFGSLVSAHSVGSYFQSVIRKTHEGRKLGS